MLVFLCTFEFTLPVNTDGVGFFVIGNDFNAVVLRNPAVFFAQTPNLSEMPVWKILIIRPIELDKALLQSLQDCQWIKKHLNVLITGPTGVGKSWIACALAQKACREGYTAIYQRLPRLFQELPLAKGDGSYSKLLNRLGKTDVLLLDDWGLAKPSAEQRRDLLEILEDRHGSRSTIVTSQLPLDQWHASIGDSTLADAIMDRLVHNAYKIKLEGDSLRKQQANLTTTNEIE